MTKKPKEFTPLAEKAAGLWLKTQTCLSYIPSDFIPKMEEALRADIELLTYYKNKFTDPVMIERAGRTIEGIQTRLLKLRAIQQSSQPSTVS
jgi:sensor domain CHASE-containing protein